VERVLRCECGYETSGPEAAVVAAAQEHAWNEHGMELSTELARALARPLPDGSGDTRAPTLEDS
jgi:hypothetical protein